MMGQAGRSLKWYVLSLFFIVGCWGMYRANLQQDIKFLGATVFGWGAAYILSLLIVKLNRETAIGSLIVWGILLFIAQVQYVPMWLYVSTGFDVTVFLNFYMVWGALVFVLGVPAMMKIFDKYD